MRLVGSDHWRSPGDEPARGDFQFATHSFREVHEINGAAELVGYQLSDYAGAEARSDRRHHMWAAPLSSHSMQSLFSACPFRLNFQRTDTLPDLRELLATQEQGLGASAPIPPERCLTDPGVIGSTRDRFAKRLRGPSVEV